VGSLPPSKPPTGPAPTRRTVCAPTFAPGETTKTGTVVVNGNGKKESNEYFYPDLYDNSSNSLFTKSRGTGTILNDD
jgi:hypothetical protein